MKQTSLRRPDREARAVQQYFESQSRGETVQHLEKVASEMVFGREYDVWDVLSDTGERWWIVTSPMNLYRQKDYVSMDYLLTFHIGLMARVEARNWKVADQDEERWLATAWRRCRQAATALEKAREAEDFQAVGMRCRECLLELAHVAASNDLVPADRSRPTAGDFIQWMELIGAFISPGEHGDALRNYIKATAKGAWQLVNWLTHARNADRPDAVFALHATEHVLLTFQVGIVRLRRDIPERCPQCASYQLGSDFRPDLNAEAPYVNVCESCGWSDASSGTRH